MKLARVVKGDKIFSITLVVKERLRKMWACYLMGQGT